MEQNNFISVSAVSNRKQLKEIHELYQEEQFQYPLAIGYQLSSKSINQGTQNPRQPKFSELGNLDRATRDYGLITAVHYYTKNNGTIIEDLERVAELGVIPSSTLLQFNTLPPSLEILRKVKEMGYKIIFKVAVSDKQSPQGGFAVWKGEDVQDVGCGDVAPLVDQVYDRRDLINYIMFDPSHGTNLALDLDGNSLAIRFGEEVVAMRELDNLGLVYAGGINPGNVEGLTKILTSFFPDRISVDIESGARTENMLDLKLIREYLVNFREAIQS
jgi:hypothetical protein